MRRLRALWLAGLALALAAPGALAHFTAYGIGGGGASIGTLAAPSIASATPGAGTVALSWSSVTAPAGSGAVAYYVSRDGGAASAACPGSAAPSSVTSCTDTGVPVGTHQYTVTAVWRSWTATSAPASATVATLTATQLVFTTQPAGATGASAFTTQPVVKAEDAQGNVVPSYSGTVTLTIASGSGASGAALSGCSGVLSNGVTTFSGCKIDKAATGYKLHASDGTLAADSNAFDVTVGPPAQLAFTTQPAGAKAGAALTTQPVVTAQDAGGNTVPSYARTVSLSIASATGTSGATLSGCNGVLAGGVTTFAGCAIDKPGSAYLLHVGDGTLAADSVAFDVTSVAATQLRLAAATTTPTAGAADNLTITALDASGNVATGYTGVHSLTFGGATAAPAGALPTVTSSAGTAVAFGTAETVSFASGVASVSGAANGAMTLHKAGTSSVTVSDGTISNGAGLPVTVGAGAAAKLAWTHVAVSSGTLSSPCLFTCTASAAGNFATFTANVSVTDADGNIVAGLGTGHTVTVSTPASGAGSGGAFTAPTAGASVTLAIAPSGAADSTQQFTFKAQNGNWTGDTLTAQTLAGTAYAAASATVTK